MRQRNDIRFDRSPATIEHHSARGEVMRNVGSFTRGSQLIRLQYMMAWEGFKLPALSALLSFSVLLCLILYFRMMEHEVQLIEMKIYSLVWHWMDLDPQHQINLTLPSGRVVLLPIAYVPFQPDVVFAWSKFIRCFIASIIGSAFLTIPLGVWFVEMSQRRGTDILKERHERGAMLVERPILAQEIAAFNSRQLEDELVKSKRDLDPAKVELAPIARRVKLGIHVPYNIAGLPYPWRLEQSHAMLIGTTGAGKTTQLRSLVRQARKRGHRSVIFDLTGAFVEAFYNPETDHILNPMDLRCPPWTIFNECDNYADFTAAAEALIPSDSTGGEPFWPMAARTLFVETCIKLKSKGLTTNGAIAYHLMNADIKAIHRMLANTIADAITSVHASKMAESIRATLNTHAHVLRFLPEPKEGGLPSFSIRDWMLADEHPGSILFITSTHTDLSLSRALLTLWMDIAVNSVMRMSRTRDLRTWFLFDEVHALHRLPAIEHGLQTARAFGGAFVLGMHSFDKLAETYGEQGAINLAALARTKLILSTADMATAKVCSDFIGNREVRETDEAYSIGAARSRDAATITPRTEVKPLVIPDDIMNLPSMHGFIKFPEGFPAARIKLEWKHYDIVADGFDRRVEMQPQTYVPDPDNDPFAEEGSGPEQPAARPDLELIGPDERGENETDAEHDPQAAKDPREITAADLVRDSRAAGNNETNEERTWRSDWATGGKADERSLSIGASDRAQGSLDLRNEPTQQKPAQREQQALIETRSGQAIGDPTEAHKHHGHHHSHEEPELSHDDGMEL